MRLYEQSTFAKLRRRSRPASPSFSATRTVGLESTAWICRSRGRMEITGGSGVRRARPRKTEGDRKGFLKETKGWDLRRGRRAELGFEGSEGEDMVFAAVNDMVFWGF